MEEDMQMDNYNNRQREWLKHQPRGRRRLGRTKEKLKYAARKQE